jgi:mono/diheme cytochrome c family protein
MRALCLLPVALLFVACGQAQEPLKPQLSPIAPSQGASVLVDEQRFVAYAADADNHVIVRLDLATHAVETTEVPGAPEQIAQLGDNRLVVTLRAPSELVVLDVLADGSLAVAGEISLPSDPFGVAVSPRGEILVTSAWGHAVTSLDAATLETRWSIDVPREPRGVTITRDGARAFISHVVGDGVTTIDLEHLDAATNAPVPGTIHALGGRYRDRVDRAIGAGTLHPQAALAYTAVLSPNGDRLFVPHVAEQNGASSTRQVPGAYGGVPVEEETSFASVAVISPSSGRVLGDTRASAPGEALDKSVFLGVAADFVVAPASSTGRQARGAVAFEDSLFIASQGTAELIELDARAFDPAMAVKRRFAIGEGPRGVAVEAHTRTLVAWNQISHDFSVISLASGAVERVAATRDPLDPEVAAGRRLFVDERDRRITRDGRSCNGCHPEGRDDAVVWKLGAGPRQTPMLVGRLDRGPYAWLAKHEVLEDNMRETMGRLGGTGLTQRELHQLAAFVRRGLVAPDRPNANSDDARVKRGRALFTSAEVGCSGCHKLETEASDRQVHTVSSRSRTDTNDAFRTPPLIFVGGTAPYFHDGRYATLEQLLADNMDRMGTTSQLSKDDLAALAAFLRTL